MIRNSLKRTLCLIILVTAAMNASGQKSRVVSVFQMIDQGKYEEAKEAIELAAWNDRTSRWPRTYYAKGLLCQTAYEEGAEESDAKKTGIYPDQLYVAYDAYERALELDVRGRLNTAISQKYYPLSNDFLKLGESMFKKERYKDALRAFEHSLLINNSELVKARVDTNLVYNTAIAAYESEDWDKAIAYLTGLHEDAYRPVASLLLYRAHIKNGDTARAEEVLMESLELYHYQEQVVIYLVNLFVQMDRLDLAARVIEDAIVHDPENYRFLWGKALIYRRMGNDEEAAESFKAAMAKAPREAKIYYHLGVIYYNRGIDLREASLKIRDNEEYRRTRKLSREQFLEAVKWFEQSYELDPFNERTISKLYQLYYELQMKDKEESMKLLLDQSELE
jgi:tetratricopeptide (TPR) repeat protein